MYSDKRVNCFEKICSPSAGDKIQFHILRSGHRKLFAWDEKRSVLKTHTVPFKSSMYNSIFLSTFGILHSCYSSLVLLHMYSPFRQQFFKMMRYNTSDIELLCIIVASIKLRACVCFFSSDWWIYEKAIHWHVSVQQTFGKKVFHIHVMFMHIS